MNLILTIPRKPLNFSSQNRENILLRDPATIWVIMCHFRNAQLIFTSATRREESKQKHQNEKSGSNWGGTAKKGPPKPKWLGIFTSKIFLCVHARKKKFENFGLKKMLFSLAQRSFLVVWLQFS